MLHVFKEASLNFPINFNVYLEFHGNLLSVGDVIVTLMDIGGKIDLEVPLKFPLDEIVEYNKFASHPMLSNCYTTYVLYLN